MVLGTVISLTGMFIALIPTLPAMLIALLFISSGAFFTHSLAYAWVSSKAQIAKASATALYLVHYYVGGSLGGFYLIYCWQHGGWQSVVWGGSVIYLVMLLICLKLKHLNQQSI